MIKKSIDEMHKKSGTKHADGEKIDNKCMLCKYSGTAEYTGTIIFQALVAFYGIRD